jgi:hypothetical protein
LAAVHRQTPIGTPIRAQAVRRESAKESADPATNSGFRDG